MIPPLFPLPGALQLSRRSFIAGGASFMAAAMLSTKVRGAVAGTVKFSGYPFSLGVASGDPAPDGVVLWTRLAPRPQEPGGGMTAEPVEVAWQMADDEGMTRVVRSGTVTANAAWGHSVHVEADGLRPNRWYWYRFKAGGEVSAVGRTRTLPAADTAVERLRFAFASCQKYDTGYFTAYEHMAREDLDLVVHLGDYIYEKGVTADTPRQHNSGEIFTLENYRARYALYKSDLSLQAAHAMAPWIVTWDDHEVANNYAGAIPENPGKIATADFLLRRAAGYQAYFEHMPLRRTALPSGPDMLLYRRLGFGRLASFHVLDTRQYRTDQPQGDGKKPMSPILMDPKGTLMGDRQRSWLFDGLGRSTAGWNVLTQQVMMARVDTARGPEVLTSMDQWSGYEFERRRVLRQMHDQKIANPVVLTGDIHSNWANELTAEPDRPEAPSVATEFVGTSITSGGDGTATPARTDELYAENPGVKYFNGERGYVRCEVTAKSWKSDYRTVPYVSRKGAPVVTRATFVVESGRPKLNRA